MQVSVSKVGNGLLNHQGKSGCADGACLHAVKGENTKTATERQC